MKQTLSGGNLANVANAWWRRTLEAVPLVAIGLAVLGLSVVSAYGSVTNYVSATSGDDGNTGAGETQEAVESSALDGLQAIFPFGWAPARAGG